MPPINANQLLNQHLDNVAIALRNKKPFTPGDFPAVRKYEQVIRDKPVEHAYVFDSTGMPVSHSVGNEYGVKVGYPQPMGFDAPLGVTTHNHPMATESSFIPRLSPGDLTTSIVADVPIRGVLQSANEVHQFQLNDTPVPAQTRQAMLYEVHGNDDPMSYPGVLNKFYPGHRERLVTPSLESEDISDFLSRNPDQSEREMAQGIVNSNIEYNSENRAEAAEYERTMPKTLNASYTFSRLPKSIPDEQMATDSFAIQRKPKPLIALEPGRSSAGSYDYDAEFGAMMNDRLARYGY